MQSAGESLKAAFLPGPSSPCERKERKDQNAKTGNHLLYLGKADLPYHPVRVRYLPYSPSRLLLYGKNGYQDMTVTRAPEFYSLQKLNKQIRIADCVQTKDLELYVICRSHCCAVLACYDCFMTLQNVVEVAYPLGCLSSVATNHSCTYLYGTNPELNCVIRFTGNDLNLSKAERFGTLWRPFDCCTSEVIRGRSDEGGGQQYLFVSTLDAGICAFNMDTMQIVAECGDDLLPGAKYLAYDAKRSLLFVSCCCERLLRCYRFDPNPPPMSQLLPPSVAAAVAAAAASSAARVGGSGLVLEGGDQAGPLPRLQKIGDFLVANRKPCVRSSGPQCVMWDPEQDQLTVVSWSHVKGRFSNKVFRVNI